MSAHLSIHDLRRMKIESRKITMVTCYDYWSARILDETEVDCVLVGDSLAMVMHGFPSTVHATTEMMALHTSAVSRGLTTASTMARRKLLISDMPFLSFRKG